MSEQYPSDAPPPEEIPPIPEVMEPSAEAPLLTTIADVPTTRRAPRWIAPAWFFFGIIVGIVGFAAYNAIVIKSAAPAATAQVDSSAAMKVAAREGFTEALATLQAEQQQQQAAQQPPTPQTVAGNAFTIRAANRQGSADAKVTVYEFSDFQ